jgi:hypothetical protein
MAMFEVFEPSSESGIDVIYDLGHALAVLPPSLGTEGLFEFPHAFLAGPTSTLLEMVAEEVKAQFWNRGIDETGFIRMQVQTFGCSQVADKTKGSFCLSCMVAQDDKVSSPGESHPQALSEPDVSLSAHPAPIIQPQAKSPSASEQRAGSRASRFFPTSTLPCADGDLASCISFEPTESVPRSYVA